MTGLAAGAWSETALVAIAYYGNGSQTNNDIQFATLTETIDIDMGDKDIDQIASIAGGRLVKKVPQDITSITMEVYPMDIDAKGTGTSYVATGVSMLLHDLSTNWDTSEPLQQLATRNRDLFRVALMWTDDTTCTTGNGAIASAKNAYRMVFAHCYCTSCKTSFTDGVLKATLVFKVTAFNPNGIANICEQSLDGSATTISALNTYNSTNYSPNAAVNYTW